MTSVVGLESARVGVFSVSGDIATTPNGLFIYQVSLPFPERAGVWVCFVAFSSQHSCSLFVHAHVSTLMSTTQHSSCRLVLGLQAQSFGGQ